MKIIILLLLIPIFYIQSMDLFAEEPILITLSPHIDNIIFDGKWTDDLEWKESSYNKISFDDNTQVHLRVAHQENFIYILIDFESDIILNKISDSAIVCFDTKNDKTKIPQSDDYCFSTTLDGKKSFTYQGNNIPAINGYFTKIPNHENLIAVGTISDKYDRYSKTPHASYEFKIPLDVLGRSNNYGFYFSVFDADSQKHYSWPHNIKKQSLISISNPSVWGDLISPDNSLPEFNFSIMSLLISSIIIFSIIIKFPLFKSNIFQ